MKPKTLYRPPVHRPGATGYAILSYKENYDWRLEGIFTASPDRMIYQRRQDAYRRASELAEMGQEVSVLRYTFTRVLP